MDDSKKATLLVVGAEPIDDAVSLREPDFGPRPQRRHRAYFFPASPGTSKPLSTRRSFSATTTRHSQVRRGRRSATVKCEQFAEIGGIGSRKRSVVIRTARGVEIRQLGKYPGDSEEFTCDGHGG